ncbi:MAG: 1-acyl-sn-glycerol-3-phosphate acyltransferase [Kordiimonadaceae bacterium]|nr:1-acyl-sn-glycerol-3-phosphate acyltransferase [Kordiimonadaceae bacterium]MBO6568030.1 1-acyl-sn-glycerol-3-phosphate acyltransferase [Kordiimonadaceae bacterium]MBO6964240.1 1-acyl-sn-glycerol-3-phosphate acyltransferase [Kordiimonadaceae bacterium]
MEPQVLNREASGPNAALSEDYVEYAGLRSNLKKQGWTLIGAVRLAAVFGASIPLISIQALMVRFSRKNWWRFAGLWHRTMCRVLGLEVHLTGLEHQDTATLYAANHISWTDIVVLGGHIPNASFVAKSEVAGWGILGKLCALHKTEFVKRGRRTDSARQRDYLAERIKEGHSLILFPEGTNTAGIHLAPFKSALFSVAEHVADHLDEPMRVQPITIAYTEMNGIPLVRSQKPWIAWLGETELFEHLQQLLSRGRIRATVEFHEPITLDDANCRKTLARYCADEISKGLERAHRAEFRLGTPERVEHPQADPES